jgi:hypothetical protein
MLPVHMTGILLMYVLAGLIVISFRRGFVAPCYCSSLQLCVCVCVCVCRVCCSALQPSRAAILLMRLFAGLIIIRLNHCLLLVAVGADILRALLVIGANNTSASVIIGANFRGLIGVVNKNVLRAKVFISADTLSIIVIVGANVWRLIGALNKNFLRGKALICAHILSVIVVVGASFWRLIVTALSLCTSVSCLWGECRDYLLWCFDALHAAKPLETDSMHGFVYVCVCVYVCMCT